MSNGRALRSGFSASVLALTVAALGWADWRLLAMPVETPRPIPASLALTNERALSAPGVPAIEVPTLSSFAVIGERPLFIEGRQYKPAAVTKAPSPELESSPEFHLSGVMLQDGKSRALIALAGAPSEWVTEGQSIGGWIVRRISAGTAELASETRDVTIELYKPGAGTP